MSWELYRWVWRVESPLYVGASPAGSLNRCRLYVPARAIWGALTAELARCCTNKFPKYAEVGRRVQESARFSYLYPAEQKENNWQAWLPCFEHGKGLIWQNENPSEEPLSDRSIRRRLLSTWPSTAIDPSSDTASEGTLREVEVINSHWREKGEPGQIRVAMVGYLFVRDEELRNQIQEIRELFIGGDVRYGLGRLKRMGDLEKVNSLFNRSIEIDEDDPILTSDCLFAHVQVEKTGKVNIRGDIEAIAGWDQAGNQMETGFGLCWVPGTKITSRNDKPIKWKIKESGLWKKDNLGL